MVTFVLQAFGLACAMLAIIVGGAWLYDYIDYKLWERDK